MAISNYYIVLHNKLELRCFKINSDNKNGLVGSFWNALPLRDRRRKQVHERLLTIEEMRNIWKNHIGRGNSNWIYVDEQFALDLYQQFISS